MDILNSISRSQPKVASQYRELAFKAYQRAVDSQAAGAIALFAAKEGAVNPELRKSLQDRQGIFEQWRLANKLLVEESTASGGASENAEINALRKKINEYDAKLLELDELVKKQYPEYFRNIFPEPRSVAGTEDLLSDDEAVLGWVLGTEKSFLWVVLSNRAELIELQTDAKTVAKEVNQIRSAIEQYPDGKFPLEVSSALFDRVFRPALPMLESVKHIYVIPDGALTTLPFHLLVTGPRSVGVATKERSANVPGRIRNLVASPTTAGMDTDENLANVPWLVRRFAITTLPSIGSLHVLKEAKKRPAADIAFLGIGDPVLSAERNSDSRKRSFNTLFMRGKTADVSAIRQAGELPESADELRALAKSLGSGESSLLLRERATETSVKGMDLSRQQVIAFATHGFLAGEIKGVAEPGLILTPPKEASELDDGVLTASEISQLKLNTDWVILSACNTAGSASNGRGQGLSGLARAFFMAGAKSLLVSHWPVVSVAAQRLTTEMFEELRKDKDIRKAEALRRAMLTTMNDSSIPFSSHPAVWAPFVVVGP
jgi:CHAT domain-containing protein